MNRSHASCWLVLAAMAAAGKADVGEDFKKAIDTYLGLPNYKAFALARDTPDAAAWGYSFAAASEEEAAAQAMDQCQAQRTQHKVRSECVVVLLGDRRLQSAGGGGNSSRQEAPSEMPSPTQEHAAQTQPAPPASSLAALSPPHTDTFTDTAGCSPGAHPDSPLIRVLTEAHVNLCNHVTLSGQQWFVGPAPKLTTCAPLGRQDVNAKCPNLGSSSSTWTTLESVAAASRGEATADCLKAVGRRLAAAARRAKADTIAITSVDSNRIRFNIGLYRCPS